MPELPEVEVVRAGLAPAVSGARVIAVDVLDHRALKRHLPLGVEGRSSHGVTLSAADGTARAADIERRLTGAIFGMPVRRGKFLWIPVEEGRQAVDLDRPSFNAEPSEPPEALLAHLGMSGQLLLRSLDAPEDRHVRIRLWIEHADHGEMRLDFADQRLFGSLALDRLTATADGAPGGYGGHDLLGPETIRTASAVALVPPLIPSQAQHIARDPLDAAFDDQAFLTKLRSRSTGVKQLLLDQRILSGVGNIYADEALWLARISPMTPGLQVGPRQASRLLTALRDVLTKALAEGGTSFDAQYVNVNGESGYFAHSLNAYGRTGDPCYRCGNPIRRIIVGGRSSHFCPRCQRR